MRLPTTFGPTVKALKSRDDYRASTAQLADLMGQVPEQTMPDLARPTLGKGDILPGILSLLLGGALGGGRGAVEGGAGFLGGRLAATDDLNRRRMMESELQNKNAMARYQGQVNRQGLMTDLSREDANLARQDMQQSKQEARFRTDQARQKAEQDREARLRFLSNSYNRAMDSATARKYGNMLASEFPDFAPTEEEVSAFAKKLEEADARTQGADLARMAEEYNQRYQRDRNDLAGRLPQERSDYWRDVRNSLILKGVPEELLDQVRDAPMQPPQGVSSTDWNAAMRYSDLYGVTDLEALAAIRPDLYGGGGMQADFGGLTGTIGGRLPKEKPAAGEKGPTTKQTNDARSEVESAVTAWRLATKAYNDALSQKGNPKIDLPGLQAKADAALENWRQKKRDFDRMKNPNISSSAYSDMTPDGKPQKPLDPTKPVSGIVPGIGGAVSAVGKVTAEKIAEQRKLALAALAVAKNQAEKKIIRDLFKKTTGQDLGPTGNGK